ncbi:surfactin synthase thioesterase subunit [Branchiibius hedensis]|uniref:Surfactin synthase thioesterase subunit n=1 Tax=Branchiibius hedensis TaxID=672460 RepID=A0A2Y9BLK2_9MICO|nr:thioesterase domain-containing protein [Branchiibius hedensis]PWJ23318.1 surfactin synthase thioesterase subunit [Branchiibius hedensis]SSA59007.1 Surfactin synthase thioesterase subunit [Branchiibius hedensis]
MTNQWLTRSGSNPDAEWRLYCCPWSGAGAGVFRSWPALLGPGVEVVSLAYPGRERRIKEPLCTSVEEIADGIIEEMSEEVDRPFALFGHSLGALVAFECALRLSERGLPPALLGVSGAVAPGHDHPELAMRHLGDREFIETVRGLQDGRDPALDHPEFVALVAPVLRADIRAAEIYALTVRPPVGCPVVGFAGTDDAAATTADVGAWAFSTTAGFSLVEVDGDHLFPTTVSGANAVTAALRARMTLTMRPGRPSTAASSEKPPRDGAAPDPAVAVRSAWIDVLDHEKFSDDSDFFAVGGNSVLLARVAAALSRQFGVRISIRALMAGPTPQHMVDLVGELVR